MIFIHIFFSFEVILTVNSYLVCSFLRIRHNLLLITYTFIHIFLFFFYHFFLLFPDYLWRLHLRWHLFLFLDALRLILIIFAMDAVLWFREIYAFYVQGDRNYVYEEKADYWTIDLYQYLGWYACHFDDQANKDSNTYVNNIFYGHIICLWFSEDAKEAFS